MLFWGFRLPIWRSPWAFWGADGGALLALSQLFACLATVCLVLRYQAAAEAVQQAMTRTTVAVMARAIIRPFICDVAVICREWFTLLLSFSISMVLHTPSAKPPATAAPAMTASTNLFFLSFGAFAGGVVAFLFLMNLLQSRGPAETSSLNFQLAVRFDLSQ